MSLAFRSKGGFISVGLTEAALATLSANIFILWILSIMTQPAAPDPIAADGLSDVEYRSLTDAILAAIEATIDRWLQQDVVDIDSNRTGGLLELSFPDDSKIVINTQPPLHELWLAARSGGFHYKYSGGRWVDTRDGSDFHEALSRCASQQAGKALDFSN